MTTTPGPSEAAFQGGVIEYAEVKGWLVAHFHDSRRQVTRRSGERLWIGDRAAAGFPDLVLVRDRVVFAELKRERGVLTAAQEHWREVLLHAHAEYYLWVPSDWSEIERVLA